MPLFFAWESHRSTCVSKSSRPSSTDLKKQNNQTKKWCSMLYILYIHTINQKQSWSDDQNCRVCIWQQTFAVIQEMLPVSLSSWRLRLQAFFRFASRVVCLRKRNIYPVCTPGHMLSINTLAGFMPLFHGKSSCPLELTSLATHFCVLAE